MRLARTIALTSCLFRAAGAQQQVVVSSPDASPPLSIELPGRVEIKLEAPGIPNTTLPVVNVMINGRGPFRAAIETGAGFIGATRAFADSVGLRQIGTQDGFNSYLVDSIRLGGAKFIGVKLAEMPRGATGVDLILGLPFFQDVLLTIDYPMGVVRLSRDSLPVANGRDILPVSHVGPFWAAPISIGGHEFSAVLDTRSAGPTMGISPEVAAALTFADSLRVVGKAGGAAIASTEVKEARLAGDVQVGAYTFLQPLLSVRALPPGFPTNPLLGDVLLRNFEVSLDQRHARLRLSHSGDPKIVLPEPARTAPAGATQGFGAVHIARPEEFTGKYGDRTVTTSNGKLYLQRDGATKFELAPTGRDAFGLVEIPEAKIEFERDAAGAVTAIRVLTGAGTWERVARGAR